MKGPFTIKFIPINEGDEIEVPTGHSKSGYTVEVNHYLGLIPGKRGSRLGWLVYGVHEGVASGQLADSLSKTGIVSPTLHVHKVRRRKLKVAS
jgi:hypothetical protein